TTTAVVPASGIAGECWKACVQASNLIGANFGPKECTASLAGHRRDRHRQPLPTTQRVGRRKVQTQQRLGLGSITTHRVLVITVMPTASSFVYSRQVSGQMHQPQSHLAWAIVRRTRSNGIGDMLQMRFHEVPRASSLPELQGR